ncbi:MAG: hypothetical protein H7211_10310 [Aquabacterium sp.]|nr:hypothetical protein [Ferruginibacter sp.]
MTKPQLIFLAIILFLPNLFNVAMFSEGRYNTTEDYDPRLAYINSLDKLNLHIDSLLCHKQISPNSYECVAEINDVIRNRFYHGYSYFTLSENWIAAIAGKLIDSGMSSKVQADKIIQNQNAACSQQVIVMMAVLRKRGISYRHLGFPHHYALDVSIADKWYFFDPDMEPLMSRTQQSEDQWHYHSDSLKQYYNSGTNQNLIKYTFGDGLAAQKGPVNEIPAPNARLFQTTTGILSKTLWCIPLLLIFLKSKNYFPYPKKRVWY